MDGFTYHDIFATKGVEYLLVIVYFVAFVFFTRALVPTRKTGGKPLRKD